MSEEKALVSKQTQELSTFADAKIFAEAAYKSGLFDDVKSEAQAVVKIMAGRELGISPLMAMNKLVIVNKHVGMMNEVMKVLYRRKGIDWVEQLDDENNPTAAEVTFTAPNRKPKTYRFTMIDAKKAELLGKDNWRKYPGLMLKHRAFAIGARDFDPDALQGMGYTPDELEDIEAPKVTVSVVEDAPAPTPKPAGNAPDDLKKAVEDMGGSGYTLSEDFLDEYGDPVTECKAHGCEWRDGKYGKWHDEPKHNQRDRIRDIAITLCDRILHIKAFDVKDTEKGKRNYVTKEFGEWIAANFNGAKLPDMSIEKQVEMLDFLMHFKTGRKEEN